MSSDTRRLLEAAMALSQLLSMHAIPHAFHGSILTAVMSDSPRCDVRLSLSHPPSSSSLHRRFIASSRVVLRTLSAVSAKRSQIASISRQHTRHGATGTHFLLTRAPLVTFVCTACMPPIVDSYLLLRCACAYLWRTPCSSVPIHIPDRNLARWRAWSSTARHLHDHAHQRDTLFDTLRICQRQTQSLVNASPHPLARALIWLTR